MRSSKAKSPTKKSKAKRTSSEKNILYGVVPEHITIIVDTNCLIGDLEIVKRIVQSKKWVVIVPSIGNYIYINIISLPKQIIHSELN
jgi:hypothetical protein